jgi:ribosomal protein S18 acetylase RimI-like enzyme
MRVIQPIHAEELEQVVRLVNSAYRGDSSRAGWTTEADLLDGQRTDAETLRAELREGAILGMREDSELMGCVYLSNPQDGQCYLGMLTIHPQHQAGGLGRALLQRAEELARHQGARSVCMTVLHMRKSLLAWYERRGYKSTGETKPFPYGDERFGLPRRPDLHFLVLKKDLY